MATGLILCVTARLWRDTVAVPEQNRSRVGVGMNLIAAFRQRRNYRVTSAAAACTLVAVGALVLTGCTSSSGAGSQSTGSGATIESPANGGSGSQSSQPPSSTPIPSLSFALAESESSLDFATDPEIETTGMMVSLVTEPLERLSTNNSFTPLLATSVAQPNPTTLRYTIRSGVKFSDGTPLTTADVIWSIQHYMAKSASSASQMPAISSVSAKGPVVTVKLSGPNPVARSLIALTVYVMEKKAAVKDGKNLGTANGLPIGTGPYTFNSYTSQAVTMSRNPAYWGKAPAVQKLTFPTITDDNARRLAIQSGSLDIGTVTNLAELPEWKAISGSTVYVAPTSTENFIGFDTTKPPFNDVHVRRAIAYSTDTAGFAKAGFDNNVSALQGMVPAYELSDVAGSTATAQSFLNRLPKYAFDQTKAKGEMAQSAFPHGFSTTVLYIETTPWMKLAGLALQQDLKPLGITVNLKPVTLNQWFTQFFTGKLQGMSIATHFNAAVNDPSGLLTYLVGKDGAYNFAHWTASGIDKARNVVLTSTSPSARWAASKTILSAIADQVPYIPLFTEPMPFVLKQGFTFASSSGINLFDLANGDWIYQVRAS